MLKIKKIIIICVVLNSKFVTICYSSNKELIYLGSIYDLEYSIKKNTKGNGKIDSPFLLEKNSHCFVLSTKILVHPRNCKYYEVKFTEQHSTFPGEGTSTNIYTMKKWI